MNQSYQKRNYTVEPYNSAWAGMFRDELDKIRPIFGQLAKSFEHIGSTAVQGLAGKPTIDILITVGTIGPVDKLNDRLSAIGYKALGGYIKPGARLFVKERNHTRLVNMHVFTKDDPHVDEMLTLRDYLRQHPVTVAEYSRLKLDLYEQFPHDYGQYRKYKDEWMENLKKKLP